MLILFGGGLALGEVLGATGASTMLGKQVANSLDGAKPWDIEPTPRMMKET